MINVENVEDIDDIDKIVGTENIVMNTMQLMSNSWMKSSIAITAGCNLAIFQMWFIKLESASILATIFNVYVCCLGWA